MSAGEIRSLLGIRLAAGAVAVALTGCATIEMRPGPTETRVLSRRPATRPEPGYVPTIKEDEGAMVLKLRRGCTPVSVETVETTRTQEGHNLSSRMDWGFGLSGAALLATGAWTVADSSKVYSDDTTGRTYNPIGPDAAKGMGIGLISLGAVAATIAVVDVVRANETKREPTRSEVDKPGNFKCVGDAASGLGVSLAFKAKGGKAVVLDLGKTDDSGELAVDLGKTALPQGICANEAGGIPSDADVLVAGTTVGEVSLLDARKGWKAAGRAAEDESWRRAQADLDTCGRTGGSCDSVRAFVTSPPCFDERGARVGQARAALDAGAWSRSGATSCGGGGECGRIHDYLRAFPDGAHREEAQRLARSSNIRAAAAKCAAARNEAADIFRDCGEVASLLGGAGPPPSRTDVEVTHKALSVGMPRAFSAFEATGRLMCERQAVSDIALAQVLPWAAAFGGLGIAKCDDFVAAYVKAIEPWQDLATPLGLPPVIRDIPARVRRVRSMGAANRALVVAALTAGGAAAPAPARAPTREEQLQRQLESEREAARAREEQRDKEGRERDSQRERDAKDRDRQDKAELDRKKRDAALACDQDCSSSAFRCNSHANDDQRQCENACRGNTECRRACSETVRTQFGRCEEEKQACAKRCGR